MRFDLLPYLSSAALLVLGATDVARLDAQDRTRRPSPNAHLDTVPRYLRDRGPGIATSMFGTYVRQGELLVYPFAEWYEDPDFEYKPKELGFGIDQDYRGHYEASEHLIFLGYGLTRNVAIELEAAMIKAGLDKSRADPSAMPGEFEESGLGDVEGQIRWRWMQESLRRPEAFSYFETVFPLQRKRRLIGTQDWEFAFGTGVTRGYSWGTMTLRSGVEYSREEGKVDVGEYAIEYLKRLSPSWRIVSVIEGNQLDEVALITELQWHLGQRAFVKMNNGWGLTRNATKYAPELGIMLNFP
jgi:hypothetical protein